MTNLAPAPLLSKGKRGLVATIWAIRLDKVVCSSNQARGGCTLKLLAEIRVEIGVASSGLDVSKLLAAGDHQIPIHVFLQSGYLNPWNCTERD